MNPQHNSHYQVTKETTSTVRERAPKWFLSNGKHRDLGSEEWVWEQGDRKDASKKQDVRWGEEERKGETMSQCAWPPQN